MRAHRRIIAAMLLCVLLCFFMPAANALTIHVKTSKATKVYQQPSTKARSLKVGKGCTMDVNAASNGWARVTKNGNTAFIKVSDLTVNESSTVRNVVGLALLQNGRPYGRSRGFDCSSLVMYCYGKYGYPMKGRAIYQSTDNRHKLIRKVSDLKLGDVLCFDTQGFGVCDHVAIYLGGGKFINASKGADKVKIGTLNSWYKDHLICARRVIY